MNSSLFMLQALKFYNLTFLAVHKLFHQAACYETITQSEYIT
jgi:hypothetical protein